MKTTTIARWVSASRKYWVELQRCDGDVGTFTYYRYRSNNGGGSLKTTLLFVGDATAVQIMQARVDAGEFLPDIAVNTMRRVI
jgi:hypothetical protein